LALEDRALVEAVLADWRPAPIREPLRAMLGFLDKLTLEPESLTGSDVAALRGAGLADEAIEDAIRVCAIFNIYDRMANALAFELPGPEATVRSARFLLSRGYA
jgi:uncharacterized peroxidase-related enzyme